MMGDAWASLAEKIFSWTTDEAGLAAFKKRRELAAMKAEVKNAIARNDFELARVLMGELERLSNAP
jgi:protein-arginine kinase activator protein McsA